MKKILVFVFVVFVFIGYSKAEQSIYIMGGPSEGIIYSEGSFINGIVGYKKYFTEKWSISAELQASLRIDPAKGNLFSLTPVFRYKFFDSEIIEPYAIAGIGALYHDLGSIHKGDKYGHRTDTDFMYHIVAGLGAEKRFDWLSIMAEIRYEHESNGNDYKNFGCDKVKGFFGIGIYF